MLRRIHEQFQIIDHGQIFDRGRRSRAIAAGGHRRRQRQEPASSGTVASEQFNTLDANRDGRISRAEAASDSKIVFTSADKNADGFLDSSEYMHRDMSSDPTTSTGDPAARGEKPRE